MKAIHIISHNAVLLRDEEGRKCIYTGKGIGFMKAKGDRINQEKIQDIFIKDQDYMKSRK